MGSAVGDDELLRRFNEGDASASPREHDEGPLKRAPHLLPSADKGSNRDALPGNRPSCLSGSAAHLQSSNGLNHKSPA
jgi:hypothetical protein